MGAERILIVEDEGLVALDLKGRLEKMNYMVAGPSSSLDEALREAESTKPDLILMDIHIQGAEDGIGAAYALRARWDVPVVFLTAYADRSTVNRALETAPFGYVLKPFRERELQIVMETALYRHRAERELKRVTEELREALDQIKVLKEFLPICAACKSIRDDEGYWSQVEAYIEAHTDTKFSHGICPLCARKLYPEFFEAKDVPKGGNWRPVDAQG